MTNWINARVTTGCCQHFYHAVIPEIHMAALECPKCGETAYPKSFEPYAPEEYEGDE